MPCHPPHPTPLWWMAEEAEPQCEARGTVRTARTGTGAISGAHNGCAQVAQVVVCHAPRAARQIEEEASPRSWHPPRPGRGEENRQEVVDSQMLPSLYSLASLTQQILILLGIKVSFSGSFFFLHPPGWFGCLMGDPGERGIMCSGAGPFTPPFSRRRKKMHLSINQS